MSCKITIVNVKACAVLRIENVGILFLIPDAFQFYMYTLGICGLMYMINMNGYLMCKYTNGWFFISTLFMNFFEQNYKLPLIENIKPHPAFIGWFLKCPLIAKHFVLNQHIQSLFTIDILVTSPLLHARY